MKQKHPNVVQLAKIHKNIFKAVVYTVNVKHKPVEKTFLQKNVQKNIRRKNILAKKRKSSRSTVYHKIKIYFIFVSILSVYIDLNIASSVLFKGIFANTYIKLIKVLKKTSHLRTPCMVTTIFLELAWSLCSHNQTPCHVPRFNLPSVMGIVKLAPIRLVLTWAVKLEELLNRQNHTDDEKEKRM